MTTPVYPVSTATTPAVATPTDGATRAHAADGPPAGTAQGDTLALARVLGRLLTVLEPLLQEPARSPAGRRAWAHLPEEALALARAEIAQARADLAPIQGGGSALLSKEGRDAASQQRTDAEHSPHFGG